MRMIDLTASPLGPGEDPFDVEFFGAGFEFCMGERTAVLDMAKTRRLLAFMVECIEAKDAA